LNYASRVKTDISNPDFLKRLHMADFNLPLCFFQNYDSSPSSFFPRSFPENDYRFPSKGKSLNLFPTKEVPDLHIFTDFFPKDFDPEKFPIISLPRNCRVKILNLLRNACDLVQMWRVKMTCKRMNLPEVPVCLPRIFREVILARVLKKHRRKYNRILESATITLEPGHVILKWTVCFGESMDLCFGYDGESASFLRDVGMDMIREKRFPEGKWYRHVTYNVSPTVVCGNLSERTFTLEFVIFDSVRDVPCHDVDLGQCSWF
jgi:hypothetical protein